MGWETRRGQRYYYRKEKLAGGRVRSIYCGTGEPFEKLGHLHRHGKFAPGGGVIDRTLFLSAQDIFDAWAEDGGRGVGRAAPAALFGVSVQTYEPKTYRSKIKGGEDHAGSRY